jgi:hypothetical protein
MQLYLGKLAKVSGGCFGFRNVQVEAMSEDAAVQKVKAQKGPGEVFVKAYTNKAVLPISRRA